MHSTKKFTQFAWSFGPLFWGLFTWFMAWGYGNTLIPYQPLNFLIRTVIGSAIVIYFFGKSLDKAEEKYPVYFFGYRIYLPSWRFFVIALYVSIVFYFTPLRQYELTQSLVLGILISTVMEELITRSIFVAYDMPLMQFFILNAISSIAFTYMHNFYEFSGVGLLQLIQNGHFAFSFALGLLAYKTKRIELTLILHMLSNLLWHTIPVCVLGYASASTASQICSTAFSVIYTLALVGCFSPQAYAYKKYLSIGKDK